MTEAQARALGLKPPAARRKKKGMARAGAKSRCATPGCGFETDSDAAEDRHIAETGHLRYEAVLE